MTEYKVKLHKVMKENLEGNNKTEIWADIINNETCESLKQLIYWEDENGTFHDESPNLPIELRDIIDNAWIEKKRDW